jgi:hypothetical protein
MAMFVGELVLLLVGCVVVLAQPDPKPIPNQSQTDPKPIPNRFPNPIPNQSQTNPKPINWGILPKQIRSTDCFGLPKLYSYNRRHPTTTH